MTRKIRSWPVFLPKKGFNFLFKVENFDINSSETCISGKRKLNQSDSIVVTHNFKGWVRDFRLEKQWCYPHLSLPELTRGTDGNLTLKNQIQESQPDNQLQWSNPHVRDWSTDLFLAKYIDYKLKTQCLFKDFSFEGNEEFRGCIGRFKQQSQF